VRRRQSREHRIATRIRVRAAEPKTVAPTVSAEVAGLRYVNDQRIPGIHRIGRNKRFRYVDPSGGTVADVDVLARIKSLVIPPAWTNVWICPNALGHLQATGRDARGRKQYRYHPRWRQVRDEVKYGRMLAFAAALPKIRERTATDLKLTGLPREKVLAAVVELLEKTLIRVGNEEYARENDSYGLTTMRIRMRRSTARACGSSFAAKAASRTESISMTPASRASSRPVASFRAMSSFNMWTMQANGKASNRVT
jgi:DNA topoisomerase-1